MRVLHQVSVALVAGALFVIPESATAQRGRSQDVRRSPPPVVMQDGRWDDDDDRRRYDSDRRRYDDDRRRYEDDRRRYEDDRRRYENDRRGNRGRGIEWARRQRAKHMEWCQRHRNDRRCAELYRRGSDWCWDVNHDLRCDNVDYRRRDSRGVLRNDRGPEWERWLRSSGVDVEALLNQPR